MWFCLESQTEFSAYIYTARDGDLGEREREIGFFEKNCGFFLGSKMGTPLAGRDGGVAVLSGAVNRVDSASAKPCLDDSEAKSPILIFLYFHKAIRTELDELQRSAMAFATGQLADIQPLFERYDFVRSIYKHHSNAEDEVHLQILL